MIFIYTTCKNVDEAKQLGSLIIGKKIASGVNFWPISSCYNWEGSFQCLDQVMLLITTFASKIEDVTKIISENHTFSVPMIAGVDVRRINHPYKEWMMEVIE
ncbi:MAG: divalent-cation tolerance protein CutA [Candidatus Pacebacteria bacterium]|nr:divalent-cation tolerance protein CutA [Candidatus Paceibacterota bacterium]